MVQFLEMFVLLSLLLYVGSIQGTYGTFPGFPPVTNAPPIPSQAARTINNPPENFSQQDFSRDLTQPREGGFFDRDRKPDEERWYEENLSAETRQDNIDTFGTYESVIGPVATPIPDDVYYAQSSNVPKFDPTDISNIGRSNIFILEQGDDIPKRWVRMQIPAEKIIQVVKQNPKAPVASDTVKSVVRPISFDIPVKSQFSPNAGINVVQVRASNTAEIQKVYTSPGNGPGVKQFVDTSPTSVKIGSQKQTISDLSPEAFPLRAPATRKSFSIPPPPLKGTDVSPKVVLSSSIDVPDPNVLVSNKNIISDSNILPPGKNVVQQVRHVWIPTSANTGKFITIPISRSVSSEKSTLNKGLSLDSTPVTVSDTWILRQDGSVPVFEQQKSKLPAAAPPVIQSGKVIFQDPVIVQVDEPTSPTVVSKKESPKNPPIIRKSFTSDVWPTRSETVSPKSPNKSPVFISDAPVQVIKSDAVAIGKSVSEPLTVPQKSGISNKNIPLPPPIPAPTVAIVNGKPCPLTPPLSPQKSFPLFTPRMTVQKLIATENRLPLARIIRINRYPTGNYYLLNRNIRPSYFIYPNQGLLQQPKAELIRVVQTKQAPVQFQRKIPVPPVQTKQISIPVQSKQIVAPASVKQFNYPFVPKQIILPAPSPKSTRIIYPTAAQAIRYAYPRNAYFNSSPVIGNGIYIPQYSPFKMASIQSDSESNSSESSEDSSEESKEKKKEAKSKKNNKVKSSEKVSSVESEKESETEPISKSSESNAKSTEIKSKEISSEKESAESLETSESQISVKFRINGSESEFVTDGNTYVNVISGHRIETNSEER